MTNFFFGDGELTAQVEAGAERLWGDNAAWRKVGNLGGPVPTPEPHVIDNPELGLTDGATCLFEKDNKQAEGTLVSWLGFWYVKYMNDLIPLKRVKLLSVGLRYDIRPAKALLKEQIQDVALVKPVQVAPLQSAVKPIGLKDKKTEPLRVKKHYGYQVVPVQGSKKPVGVKDANKPFRHKRISL